MCTCVQQLIGGGRCTPNAALSPTHLAAHLRPLYACAKLPMGFCWDSSPTGVCLGKSLFASSLVTGGAGGSTGYHNLIRRNLSSSSHPFFLQLESGDGLRFIKAVFSSYMPCIGGLWNFAVPGTYDFSVFGEKLKQNKPYPNLLLKLIIKTTNGKEAAHTEYDERCWDSKSFQKKTTLTI